MEENGVPGETTNPSKVNATLYHKMLYRVHLAMNLVRAHNLVMIGTDYTCSCKFNYHTIFHLNNKCNICINFCSVMFGDIKKLIDANITLWSVQVSNKIIRKCLNGSCLLSLSIFLNNSCVLRLFVVACPAKANSSTLIYPSLSRSQASNLQGNNKATAFAGKLRLYKYIYIINIHTN